MGSLCLVSLPRRAQPLTRNEEPRTRRPRTMCPQTLQRLITEGGHVRLSGRACFRLVGSDRVRYLNGQVTNDVRQVNEQRSVYACVTDIKGHVVGDVFVHAAAEALWLDAEPGLRDVLAPRLERYIIADDAELSDVTDDWQVWHVFGPAAGAVARAAGRLVGADRLGVPGVDVWLSASESAPVLAGLPLTLKDFEALRIQCGIPRWPQELNASTFPPEAGLDARAMSYTKGCYIGQEILSRIRTTGKMPRTLLLWESDLPVQAGDEVFSEARVVGEVTSVTSPPSGAGSCGLAFVKQGCNRPDSILLAGRGAPSIALRVRTPLSIIARP